MTTSQDRLAEVMVYYEKLWRSRTPARNALDIMARQRVMYSDLLAKFPDLDALDRETIFPAAERLFKKLKREFPNERWDKC